MKNEYEATFLEVDEKELKSKLLSLGAKLSKPKTLMKRFIFNSPHLRKKNAWVRLRDEGDNITLTLKQVIDSSNISGTKEIEFIVNDLNSSKDFCLGVGLEMCNYQENYREEWILGDIKYDFDSWPDIPTFLEIEGPDEISVKRAVTELGLLFEDAWFGSIDKIYLEKYRRDILQEKNLLFK